MYVISVEEIKTAVYINIDTPLVCLQIFIAAFSCQIRKQNKSDQ